MVGAEVVAIFNVVGPFLSPVLDVLLDRIATFQVLESVINLFQGTKLRDDLLQEMEILLLRVEKVLGDAEEKQITNPSVKKWVDKLQDAAYDADDLLDAIATAIEFERPVKEQQAKDFNSRLEKIVARLKLNAAEKDILSLKEVRQGRKLLSRLPSTSLVDESEECFRNDDKEYILEILLSDAVNPKEIPVIAIVGMGGIGKTALAQFLYNDDRVKNSFDLRAWVHVSEEFDVFKVTKTIYESATLSSSNIEDLNALQVTLERKLMGRKFLLVLDNVWNESFREWDLLRRPLQVGAPGSKIVVTTRNRSVSSTIRDVLVRELKALPEKDCRSLFAKHAFGNTDQEEDPTLKAIGEQIVKKCNGLPLAIKTLGSLLHSEVDVEEWSNIRDSRIWDLPDHKSDILPALRLSYHYLPSQLKRCFAYCSIFPKNRRFEKQDLIRLWIAEGLVQQPNSRRRKEEVGQLYFDELLSRSLFQQSRDRESCFTMHDLINDLAQHIAGEFCFKIDHDSTPANSARVRHLSCKLKPDDTPDKFVAFYDRNTVLRTFHPFRSSSDNKAHFKSIIWKLFPEPSCLRVLSLSSYNITELPDSVGNLKQLRYLDLSSTAIQRLPEKVDCLYSLETLKLSGCHRLKVLPAKLGNFVKLEHLDINATSITELPDSIHNLKQLSYMDISSTNIQFLPNEVCLLDNLQTLKLSNCRGLTSLPADIGILTKLKHLDISATSITELPASIHNLKQLSYMDLSHSTIQFLPNEVCLLDNLQTLKLSHCRGLTSLPADMRVLTKLKHLHIKGTPILQMPPNFGKLKRLQQLTDFVVGNNNRPSISELKDLSLLSGTLSISRLRNVSTIADAENANLKGKRYLCELILEWDVDPPVVNEQNATYGPDNRNTENATNVLNDNSNAQNAANSLTSNGRTAADGPVNGDGEHAVDDPHSHGHNAADNPPNGHSQNTVEDTDNSNEQHSANEPCTKAGNPSSVNMNNAANDDRHHDAETPANNPHNGSIAQNTEINAMDSLQLNRDGQSAGEDPQNGIAEHVLDKLQPGRNLERLEIKNFLGMSFPVWLGDASFSKMRSITLNSCQQCNALPPLGQLPSLKELDIHDLPGVINVGSEFYGTGSVAFKSLETLIFQKMKNWVRWFPCTDDRGFPSLRSLQMLKCRKLEGSLPIVPRPPKVQIDECGEFDNQKSKEDTIVH